MTSDDDDEAPLDFKVGLSVLNCSQLNKSFQAEKRRYAMREEDIGNYSAPPVAKPPKYPTQPAASGAKQSSSRPLKDAGSRVDPNFVQDDWDDDDDEQEVTSRRKRQTPQHSQGFVGGVRPDQDWLGEDFDD